MKRALFLSCLVLSLVPIEADAAPRRLDGRVAEAALFKNGLAYLVREIAVPASGDYEVGSLPVPVHGSFWLEPPSGLKLSGIVAAIETRGSSRPATSWAELLAANVGRRLEVRTETEGWVSGVVVALPAGGSETTTSHPEEPVWGRWSGLDERRTSGRPFRSATERNAPSPTLLLLEADKGLLALALSDVRAVRGAAGTALERQVPVRTPAATLRFHAEGAGQLRLLGIVRGLSWAPSVRVSFDDGREAEIEGKAVLVNDVEDLAGTKVEFVTGFPNIAFSGTADPMGLAGSLDDFLRALQSSGSTARGSSPVVAQQAIMVNVADSSAGLSASPVPGQASEDLFFYPQAGVTLGSGERGYFPLWSKRVPCESLHLWEIGDSLDESALARRSWERDGAPKEEEVWHVLRLQNNTGMPWTTAPALTFRRARPAGQDTLGYTSAGAKTILKVTRAMDVAASTRESEVARVRAARTEYGNRELDLVTIEGRLDLTNGKGVPVTILVRKTLSGEILETTPHARSEKAPEGALRLNPKQLLTWELPVEPGKSVTLKYRYKVYVGR